MQFNHLGLVCRSEKNSDRFYRDLLGMEKLQSKVLPAEMSYQIFGLKNEYRLINYGKDNLNFEIFISSRQDFVPKQLGHLCLEIEDLPTFLQECEEYGVEINRIPKQDQSFLTFVKDFDGNLFEIKEKP